ncbi:MAG: ATP-binding protein [Rectinema subterraneum]|uniref:ATP-binding protein n=1 Tax=Rectinema subterraneum TaxID=2653714 RepID=UPI003C79BA7E
MTTIIPRPALLERIENAFAITPIVTLLGARQCGKTTIARIIAQKTQAHIFDLEDPADNAALSHPMLALSDKRGLIVIDEVQRRPELFPILRVLVDRPDNAARFLLLGSASPHLVRGVSESLAGRTSFVDMQGFSLDEVGSEAWQKLWLRGGFPRSWLADSDAASLEWRKGFIRTFLERDVPQLGISIPAAALSRFWTMIAHYHAQVWNSSVLARSLGISDKTVTRYLEILEGTFLVRRIPPWYENLGKRLVKSPKVYIRDSGILHALLAIADMDALLSHPSAGASWEGYALETVLSRFPGSQTYFYATHSGAELDLILVVGTTRYGFEMKLNQAPTLSRSMTIALEDLRLSHLYVVYPGIKTYPLAERITAVPLQSLPEIAE